MNIRDFEVPVEDRGAFAKVMAFMAAADGQITLEEKQVIDDLVFAWQIDSKTIEDIYSILNGQSEIGSILSQIKNIKTAYLLIQELVTLANLDGSYADVEKRAVRMIASSLNVTERRVAEIEQWVVDGVAWRTRGLELLCAEGVEKWDGL